MYMPLAAAPAWLSFSLIMVVINDSDSSWAVAGSSISADCADHHVSPNVVTDSAGVAVCPFYRPADVEHYGNSLDFGETLPRRHPHVRKARNASRTVTLAAL